jgi:sugar lactone lactonase YvrE
MKQILYAILIAPLFLVSSNIKAQSIYTYAGNGNTGYTDSTGDPKLAEFNHPWGLTFDGFGNLYIADHVNCAIRKISVAGTISTFAGTTSNGFSGDGGPASMATMSGPTSVTADPAGNLYIADAGNNRIRKVSTTGIITTIAGNDTSGYAGDGGPATAAKFYKPMGISADISGNLFIADSGNNVVRKIDGAGIITTYAGNGTPGYTGDGGPAISASLSGPVGVTWDHWGNLYITEAGNHVVRKVSVTGIITTFAGTGTAGFGGDGAAATAAQLSSPNSVTFDTSGNVYISDEQNHRIRKVTNDGIIHTIAGIGIVGYSGDGGPAINAQLFRPMGLAVDVQGRIFIADYINSVVRKIDMENVAVNMLNGSRALLNLYPIPAHDKITVDISGDISEAIEMEVVNVLGQQILTTTVSTPTSQIDVSMLPTGCYFINLFSRNTKLTSAKLIKY